MALAETFGRADERNAENAAAAKGKGKRKGKGKGNGKGKGESGPP